METQSIPWWEKVQLIVRFLRGSIHYFVVALLCACLGMVFNALTPQVIRLTVDSILRLILFSVKNTALMRTRHGRRY